MTAPGLKARQNSSDSHLDALFQASQNRNMSSIIRIECDLDVPPRLCHKDLKDPEQFHQRLVEWLLKQR
jgi:hypothetical protein